jgi:hypothetical protein
MNFIKCHKCGREEPAFDYAHICGPLTIKPKINQRIRELAKEAGYMEDGFGFGHWDMPEFQKFVELFKQAIYDKVKEELIPDELVDIEPDSLMRQYLKGCNGGTVDALIHIKNFGVDVDE